MQVIHDLVLAGTVQYLGLWQAVHRELLEEYVKKRLDHRFSTLASGPDDLGSYFVCFSQAHPQAGVHCSITLCTRMGRTFHGAGFASRPNHAFNRADESLDRLAPEAARENHA